MFTSHPTHTINPDYVFLACRLAACEPGDLQHVVWRDDQLVVILATGAKHVFTAHQIFDAGWRDGQLLHYAALHIESDNSGEHMRLVRAQMNPEHTPAHIAALEAVSNAHPGELEAAKRNAPAAPTYVEQYHKAAAAITEAEIAAAKPTPQAPEPYPPAPPPAQPRPYEAPPDVGADLRVRPDPSVRPAPKPTWQKPGAKQPPPAPKDADEPFGRDR
jgi:hypothetical protein